MDLHKNARSCPKSRALMVRRILEEGQTVPQVAEAQGLSERSVYRWLRRYRAEGLEGLEDRSSSPHQVFRRLGKADQGRLVRLRIPATIKNSDSGTRRNGDRAVGDLERFGNLFTETLDRLRSNAEIFDIVHHHGELVLHRGGSNPRAAARRVAQWCRFGGCGSTAARGYSDNQLVADSVTVGIVDGLKIVEIQKQHRG